MKCVVMLKSVVDAEAFGAQVTLVLTGVCMALDMKSINTKKIAYKDIVTKDLKQK